MKIHADAGGKQTPIVDNVTPLPIPQTYITVLTQPLPPVTSSSRHRGTSYAVVAVVGVIVALLAFTCIHAAISYRIYYRHTYQSEGECTIESIVTLRRPEICTHSFDLKCFTTINTFEAPCGTGLYPEPFYDDMDESSGSGRIIEAEMSQLDGATDDFRDEREEEHYREHKHMLTHRRRYKRFILGAQAPPHPPVNEPLRSTDARLMSPPVPTLSAQTIADSLTSCLDVRVNFTSESHSFKNKLLHADFNQPCAKSCSFGVCLNGMTPVIGQSFTCRFQWMSDDRNDVQIAAGENTSHTFSFHGLLRMFRGRIQILVMLVIVATVAWLMYHFLVKPKTMVTPLHKVTTTLPANHRVVMADTLRYAPPTGYAPPSFQPTPLA